jgi:hypothetical protein
MNPFKKNHPPSPEQLAAYADGELPPQLRRWIENWLREHPEAAGDVAADLDLINLARANPPSLPCPGDWDQTLAGIEHRLEGSPCEPRGLKSRLLVMSASLVAAAAALFVACTIDWTSTEPLLVASSDEVDIISVDPEDRDTLVVGEVPAEEPLLLAVPGDVVLKRVDPADDGQVPDVMPTKDEDTPIIVFHLEKGG